MFRYCWLPVILFDECVWLILRRLNIQIKCGRYFSVMCVTCLHLVCSMSLALTKSSQRRRSRKVTTPSATKNSVVPFVHVYCDCSLRAYNFVFLPKYKSTKGTNLSDKFCTIQGKFFCFYSYSNCLSYLLKYNDIKYKTTKFTVAS